MGYDGTKGKEGGGGAGDRRGGGGRGRGGTIRGVVEPGHEIGCMRERDKDGVNLVSDGKGHFRGQIRAVTKWGKGEVGKTGEG